MKHEAGACDKNDKSVYDNGVPSHQMTSDLCGFQLTAPTDYKTVVEVIAVKGNHLSLSRVYFRTLPVPV